eukprot:m.634490 g.634490  ORF g.634490 m.634490 type:complete len:52 (+) comp58302_c0_seq2:189-344(+)
MLYQLPCACTRTCLVVHTHARTGVTAPRVAPNPDDLLLILGSVCSTHMALS